MLERPIPSVDVREAHRRLSQPPADQTPAPVLVDVREVSEYLEARADGAYLLPLSQLMARYRELPTDRPLLMICRSGGRSMQATAFLMSAGWSDVTNVAGGTMAWLTAALPARSGPPDDEETSRTL